MSQRRPLQGPAILGKNLAHKTQEVGPRATPGSCSVHQPLAVKSDDNEVEICLLI